MKKVIILWFVLSVLKVNAQSYLPINGVDGVYTKMVKVERKLEFEGEPYFKEDWAFAKVTLVNNKDYVTKQARINFLTKQLEFIEQGTVLEVPLKATKVVLFPEAGVDFETDQQGVLYQKIKAGENIIWKNVTVTMKDQYSYLAGKNVILLNPSNSYYFGQDVQNLKRIKQNKKDVINIYPPEKRKIAEEFIKKNQLNMADEQDFLKVFQELSVSENSDSI